MFEPADHSKGGNSGLLIGRIEDHFTNRGEEMQRVRELAAEVSDIVAKLDPFIEQHTASVCPDCRTVCCINRHSYHTHEDIVCLFAMGEKVPTYDLSVPDSSPCQFLGRRGCTVTRALRPHRCNSYFCGPLLDHIEEGNVREYRRFIELLKALTDTRMDMLDTFLEVIGKSTPQGCNADKNAGYRHKGYYERQGPFSCRHFLIRYPRTESF